MTPMDCHERGWRSLGDAAGRSFKTWADMIKLAHSVFALPFALLAAFLAGRHLPETYRPTLGQLLLIVACMVCARSAAMTFNRIADAVYDAGNPRTANRPLPAGRITRRAAWAFLLANALGFELACFGFLRLYDNPWPLRLSLPVLIFICGYSYAKRFTRWSHFWLGAGIAFAPAAAWLAVHPQSLGWPAVLLMGAVTAWIAGFDIIYACQDIDTDVRQKLFSLPSRMGPGKALLIARVCHALTVALLVSLGLLTDLGGVYFAGVVIVAFLLLYEHHLVRPNDFSRVNLAFFTFNGIVSLLLGALGILDILLAARNALYTAHG